MTADQNSATTSPKSEEPRKQLQESSKRIKDKATRAVVASNWNKPIINKLQQSTQKKPQRT